MILSKQEFIAKCKENNLIDENGFRKPNVEEKFKDAKL